MAAPTLSAEQLQSLIEAHLELDLEGGAGTDATRFLSPTSHAARILGAAVAIITMRKRGWSLQAHSSSEPRFEHRLEAAGAFTALVDSSSPGRARLWTDADGRLWTLVAIDWHPPAIVAIHGDWMVSSDRLLLWSRVLAAFWRAGVGAARARSRLSVHRLARTLARASGLPEVCNAIVRSMAWAVKARLAALAVPTPPDNHLVVMATHGYSLDLVKHLHITPGSGVIGSVFESGRTFHGSPRQDGANSKRRPRYRTDSFIATPIRSGSDVTGVICVTDRIDDQAFTHEDASALRALAAPAALALARETALVQMRQFAHGAAVDPLSGCFNRRHFHARLDEELQRSRRDRLTLALMMIDIDDFKSVNDSFGHVVGDTVIKDVAEILRRSVRGFDVCSRFGGEEFAVLMPASTVESASKVAGRIRERIEAYRPAGLSGVRVTASVGLSVSSAATSASDLLARSDDALYAAKREGKNRLRIFSLETSDRAARPTV
jgi:diguanylate cyclase (GGDEF)-like protein